MGRNIVGYNGTGEPGLATGVDNSYFLLEILLPNGSQYFYSLGPHDISKAQYFSPYTTRTYTTNNQIKVIGNVKESYDPNGNEITIEWSTASLSVNLINDLGLKKFNTRFLLFVGSGSNFTKVYDGYVTSLTESTSASDRVIQVKCQSAFRNLSDVKGRKTTDVQAWEGKTITWGTTVWQ
jgi:hypothetical protein